MLFITFGLYTSSADESYIYAGIALLLISSLAVIFRLTQKIASPPKYVARSSNNDVINASKRLLSVTSDTLKEQLNELETEATQIQDILKTAIGGLMDSFRDY